MDYTQKQLEEMVVGKPIDPTVQFFEQALMDPVQSKAAGHRVYNNTIMIKRQVPGVSDYVAQRATKEDIAKWPAEYMAFKHATEARKYPGLEVLYGITNIEKQELIDRGYGTLERLAAATDLPPHLAHLKLPAIRIYEAITAEEVHHDVEEEDQQEGSREEAYASSRDADGGERGATRGSDPGGPAFTGPGNGGGQSVPAPRRQDDDRHVGQPGLQEVRPGSGEQPAGGNEAGGRQHRAARVKPYDWQVDLNWSN